MSPLLKFAYIIGWILKNVFSLSVGLLIFPFALALLILLSPHAIYYYSANFSMVGRDMPIVQLYLDHFESLYPELIAFVAAA
jgi:hypothetical protein